MQFTYKDWSNVKIGSDEYKDICHRLFMQYGANLKALTVEDSDDFIKMTKELTAIINEKNLMKTRDLEELIHSIRQEKIKDPYIKNFCHDKKAIIYYYLALQVAKICQNSDMEKFYKNLLDKELNNDNGGTN